MPKKQGFFTKLFSGFTAPEPTPEPPKPVVLKKRTTKLVSKKQMVDLGATSILLKFSDGRELVTKIYGNYESYGNEGRDEYLDIGFSTPRVRPVVEPYIEDRGLTTSLKKAEEFIKSIPQTEGTYTDCPRVPTKSEVGKVITATIIKTEANLQEVTKYSVEPV